VKVSLAWLTSLRGFLLGLLANQEATLAAKGGPKSLTYGKTSDKTTAAMHRSTGRAGHDVRANAGQNYFAFIVVGASPGNALTGLETDQLQLLLEI